MLPVSRRKIPVIRSIHPRGSGCHGCCAWGHGVWDATTDPDAIAAWGRAYPWAQPAVACGASGLVVIDVDGDAGESTLARLEATHGALPRTRVVSTGRPGGGRHLWFRTDRDGLHPRHLPGLDLNAGASYVVAPGARHRSGTEYAVVDDTFPADAPAWLEHLCAAGSA